MNNGRNIGKILTKLYKNFVDNTDNTMYICKMEIYYLGAQLKWIGRRC